MIPRKLAPLIMALASLSLSGCVTRIMDFTVISSKNVDIPGTRGEKVEGEDMKSIVIVFPTGQPNIKEAVDRALEKGNGDVLLDGVIYAKSWYIPYVYGQTGFVVDGTAMRTSRAGVAPAASVKAAAPAAVAPAEPQDSSFVPKSDEPPKPEDAPEPEVRRPRISDSEVAAELLP